MAKTILVTGAAGGIGSVVLKRRLRAGDFVIGIDRDTAGLARASDELFDLDIHGRFVGCVANLAEPGFEHQVVARLDAHPMLEHASIDAIVHCSGVGGWQPFSEVDLAVWSRIMDTNACGPVMLTRALIGRMRHHGGTLVHVSSDAALHPFVKRAAYCASKAAAAAAFEVIREELRPLGIRVSTIYCNRVDTAFNGGTAGSRPEALQPEDIARAIDEIIELRSGVELRSVTLAAQHSPFGT